MVVDGKMPVITVPRKKIMYIHLVQNTLKQETLFLPTPEVHGQVLLTLSREARNMAKESIPLNTFWYKC
jgi:hypothetical protein